MPASAHSVVMLRHDRRIVLTVHPRASALETPRNTLDIPTAE